MNFRSKLRKIGNSQGVYIPLKVITGYKIGDIIELKVITSGDNEVESAQKVITSGENKQSKVITSDIKKKWVFNPKKGINEFK